MIIVYNYKNKKPFTIIGKRKNGGLPDEPEITEYTDMLYFAPRNFNTNVQVKISEDCIVDEFKYTTSSLLNTDIKSLNYDELNYPTVFKGETIEISSLSGTHILWKGALRNNSSVDTPIFEIITDTEENNEVNISGELNNGSFDYAYYYMFNGNTALSNIGTGLVLTSEYVGRSAYQNMFFNCSNFDDGGDIHISAKIVGDYGLGAMFSGCSSLTTTPYLGRIEQIGAFGMASMFSGTAITTAPALPNIELTDYCYSYMFSGCSSLTTAPALPSTNLANYCYMQMFQNCTSLTTAPELPSTELVFDCYRYMFSGCTNLNYVKHNITEWNSSYTTNWLNNVSATGIVECPLNSTIPSDNVSGIPSGWTRVNF